MVQTGAAGAVRENNAGIGLGGALSIGIGGIVGGGFFATFGLAVSGARGATCFSFLVGGILALLTAYSYTRLTLWYPGPGGTISFITLGLGSGVLPTAINRLLVWSYIAVMAIYAHALGAYSASYLPPDRQTFWTHVLASGAIVGLALVNFAGGNVMAESESFFNISKLGILAIFIVGGFVLGHPSWERLGPANWVSATTIVASGMVVFLSYEGFELISNASGGIREPARTLPIAFYGSVLTAVAFYVLAIIVAIGHMPFAAMEDARDFALSATAARFMGSFGFGMMTIGAVLASASAINADFSGAVKLPVIMSQDMESPRVLTRTHWGRHVASMIMITVPAVLAVNFINLHALSAVTSGGFLIVFAAVNFANVRLARETKSQGLISLLAALSCIAAVGIMLVEFAQSPKTRSSAYAVVAEVVLSVISVFVFRWVRKTVDYYFPQ